MTVVLILAFSAFEGVRGRPNGQEERRDGGMSNALKYLEELDKYYSQVARPRYFFYFFVFPNHIARCAHLLFMAEFTCSIYRSVSTLHMTHP